MSVLELLRTLTELGVELSAEGDRLRIKAPKGALSPELQRSLRDQKEALLEVLTSVRSADAEAPLGAIVAHDPSEPAPLSAAQHRLWFLDQLHPGTAFLNLPFTVRLAGELDLDVLRWVIAEVGRRHDALRSSIRLVGDEPMQLVSEKDLELELVDVSGLPAEERDAAVLSRRAAEMARPFDLAVPPLIRFILFRKAPDDHWFMFVTNHVVFDGWSHDILFREVRQLYEAKLRGEPLPPGPPVRFADFVRWHREWLEGPRTSAQLEYWQRRLEGMPGVLNLPTDRPRPAELSNRGINHIHRLDAELVSGLRRLGLAHGATLNMVAMASVQLLLAKYSGQTDFGVGVPVHGRVRPECEELIGMFVNTLVLRSEVGEATTFRDLLCRVKDRSIEALANQDLPFEKLVQVLQPARDRSRTPLYQAIFSYQEASNREYRMADLELTQVPSFSGSTGTDVTFWIRDHGTWALAVVEASADLFDEDTLAVWLRSWLSILQAVVEQPDLPLERVPVIAAEDRHELLNELNDTSVQRDPEPAHVLFERVVDEHRQRVAVCFEDRQITFGELDERSNRIARALIARGVGPDALVGVCLHRGVDLVAALLGVLKAGGAYLPLDPAYPRERIAYYLEDAGARVLISTSDLAGKLAVGAQVLSLDEQAEELSGHSTTRPTVSVGPDQLAYVIYTSGSTGKPKGVMVAQKNLHHFFVAMRDAIDLDATGVWLAATSTSFDISVLEIIGCLCHGRTVVVAGDMFLGQVADPRFALDRLASRYQVTHFQCTPSQARLLLLQPEGRALMGGLRQLILGGEALGQDLADELAALVPGEVINGYGPTETTIYSTMARVRRGETVTIGRPVANTCVFIVDAQGELVPRGAVGELWIGGKGVTRGYLGRQDLTAERFLPNRFRPELGALLYRTGDMVRWDNAGNLLYLGRNDHQVKIRGYRIELGEIEAALRAEPGVKDAVVVAHGDGADKRLVAYLQSAADLGAEEALREALREKLPEFMVPAVFIRLETFPLTPNGKVDRKALPAPADVAVSAGYVAPKTETERKLCRIWADVLRVPQVGLNDNFFDLGGHSLLAVRIFNDVHRSFGVRLPLAALFEAPTVGQLSKRLAAAGEGGVEPSEPRWTTVVPIQPRGTLPPFFCVAGVGGNPMNLLHVAQAMGKDQPFYGLQLRGVDGARKPHRSVQAMAAEFLQDILEVQPTGPYYLGGYSMGGLAAYEVARMLRARGEKVGLVVLFDTFNPTLPTWTPAERVSAHFERLRAEGLTYLRARVVAGASRRIARARRQLRARLGADRNFEYRHEEVEAATIEAEMKYVPGTYAGDVLLIQAQLRLSAGDGIGYRTHESNGWRDFITGRLDIQQVDCQHLDIVKEESAPRTAEIIVRALAAARETANAAGPEASEPPSASSAAPNELASLSFGGN